MTSCAKTSNAAWPRRSSNSRRTKFSRSPTPARKTASRRRLFWAASPRRKASKRTRRKSRNGFCGSPNSTTFPRSRWSNSCGRETDWERSRSKSFPPRCMTTLSCRPGWRTCCRAPERPRFDVAEALSSLCAAEFFLQLAIIHLEECWPSVRAGVGHRAGAQVFNQLLQLRPAERVVRLDRVAANRFRHGLFAQPEGIDLLAGSHEFINQLRHTPTRVRHFHERRQRIEQKGALAKFAQADSQTPQDRQVLAQE